MPFISSIPCMHIELLDALGNWDHLDDCRRSWSVRRHLTSLVADGAAALDMPQELDMPMSELKEKAFELDSLGSDVLIFLAASTFVVPLSRLAGIARPRLLAIGCAIGPYGLQLFSDSQADVELGDFRDPLPPLRRGPQPLAREAARTRRLLPPRRVPAHPLGGALLLRHAHRRPAHPPHRREPRHPARRRHPPPDPIVARRVVLHRRRRLALVVGLRPASAQTEKLGGVARRHRRAVDPAAPGPRRRAAPRRAAARRGHRPAGPADAGAARGEGDLWFGRAVGLLYLLRLAFRLVASARSTETLWRRRCWWRSGWDARPRSSDSATWRLRGGRIAGGQ